MPFHTSCRWLKADYSESTPIILYIYIPDVSLSESICRETGDERIFKPTFLKETCIGLFSVVTVIDAVSAAILPVWVDFTSLKGLPCVPGSTGDDPKGHAGD